LDFAQHVNLLKAHLYDKQQHLFSSFESLKVCWATTSKEQPEHRL